MKFRFFSSGDLLSRAERARRLHSCWLTEALRGHRAAPRIPTRRVADGGFDEIMTTGRGRTWAMSWWTEAFERAE